MRHLKVWFAMRKKGFFSFSVQFSTVSMLWRRH